MADFYFSHRIYFFMKSVVLDNIVDKKKKEAQKKAVEDVMNSMHKMISDDVAKQVNMQTSQVKMQMSTGDLNEDDGDKYTERLFLSNSKDLVRLVVNYNMDFFYPQLQGCKYVDQIKVGGVIEKDINRASVGNGVKADELKKQILNWQEQRLSRV